MTKIKPLNSHFISAFFPLFFFFHLLLHSINTEIMPNYQYETVKVEVSPEGVAHVQLNRPKKLNAFNDQ